jgi:hypothetical protein
VTDPEVQYAEIGAETLQPTATLPAPFMENVGYTTAIIVLLG